MLSVSGMRGIVGQSMTPQAAVRFAQCFGLWLLKQEKIVPGQRVIVGRDSRTSGPMIESAVMAGLMSLGLKPCRVGILSTPGVAMLAKQHQAGALMITASHNPIPWNGIKPITPLGSAPARDDAMWIIDRYHESSDDWPLVDATADYQIDEIPDAVAQHIDEVCKSFDTQAIEKTKIRAIVDATHGAGAAEASRLLETLGVDFEILYAEPTGRFVHSPEPLEENLMVLAQTVQEQNAQVGFAIDPDADRLAIVDETGNYLGEEYTLALAAKHLLSQGDVAVTNLSTSRMIDDVAKSAGATIIRTPVGEANVAQGMRDHHAKLGGEGNGGVIIPELSWVRDSFAAMGVILEMISQTGKSLSVLASEIPSYAIVKHKVPRKAPFEVSAVADQAQTMFPDASVDVRDGLRLDWADRWLSVRASNTEPILRLIAESPSAQESQALIEAGSKLLSS